MVGSRVRMLVLDDDIERFSELRRSFPDAQLEWETTAEKCIERLHEPWDVIRLDHDLGGETWADSSRPDTGMEVVRHLVSTRHAHLSDTVFIVHTCNAKVGHLSRTREQAACRKNR